MARKRTSITVVKDVEEVPYPPPEVPAQVNGPQIQQEEPVGNIDMYSRLVTQHNFLIGFYVKFDLTQIYGAFFMFMQTEQFRNNVLELWMKTLTEEIEKRHAIEASLKHKEKLLDRFRRMYNFYMGRTTMLEDIVQRRLADAGVTCSTAASTAGGEQEEVASSLEPNYSVRGVDVKCKNCMNRPANMLWFPCRHLCVCLACDEKVKVCPMCGTPKISGFVINLPYPH
ncbi:uncharacterized protein LOC112519230 [Cynara cardunculus var. scolymus]|uniref:uncharacterized protein LOC112519230 n=1 Tax=Cynara cardunculus var. scolymus TaxID=59895 RepID=UPI000D628802|nr:uncharacterized protein LOC112519230 [Cynara cardunculus var. scolymus]